MAKNETKQRFPSDANQPKNPAKKKDDAPLKTVEGKKQNLIQVHYKKENNHLLDHVHAVSKGDNHIPKEALDRALKNPANKKLVADGDLILPKGYDCEESEEESEEQSEDGDTGSEDPSTEGDDLEKLES